MSEEFGPNIISIIEEESGEEIELEFIDALEYNGIVYRAFFPVLGEDAPEGAEDSEEYGLIILKAENDGGEELLATIEDEEELNAVYDLFMEQLFEDAED